MSEPVLLTRRLSPAAAGPGPVLVLALDADARTRLRGLRRSACGRDLLLQLPRGEALAPGELLSDADGTQLVRVEAAPEPLLLVRAAEPIALLRAAYHLGNRHVALELRPGELRLLEDPVLADLLVHRGLVLERRREPFLPEGGAYAIGHGDSHSHGHSQSHSHGAGHSHGAEHSPGDAQIDRHSHASSPGHGDRQSHDHASTPSPGARPAAGHAPDSDLPPPPGAGPDPGPSPAEARSQSAGAPR